MNDESSPGSSRTKRQRSDRSGRFAALEKLKQLQGNKHKCEVADIENVYEEVDEKEYTKRVQKRQDDDWIIDDDGAGYVEDGREIFDDDLDDESIIQASHKKKRSNDYGKSKRPRLSEVEGEKEKSSNIRSMIMNMPGKKKKPVNVNLEEDFILGDIMQEIHGSDLTLQSKAADTKHHGFKNEMSPSKYLKSLVEMKPKPIPKKSLMFECSRRDRDVKLERLEADYSCELNVDVEMNECKATDDVDSCNTTEIEDENALKRETIMEEMFSDDFVIDEAVENIDIKTQSTGISEKRLIVDDVCANSQCNSETKLNLGDDVWTIPDDGNRVTSADIVLDPDKLPLVTDNSSEKVLRLYWLDAYEEPYKQPGIVFLFGKVWIESAKTFVSCCVSVKDIWRRVFLLPREKVINNDGIAVDVSIMDVYKEFNEKATDLKILDFKTRKVEKNYCFHPDIPQMSEYLEVQYPAMYPALPSDLSGKTFSHVFGVSSGALERFLLDQKIKGPCWLDVQNPQLVKNLVSWCKVEASVSGSEMVSVSVVSQKLAPPPLVLLALQVKTALNPRNNQNEVAVLAGLINYEFSLDGPPPTKLFQQHFSLVAPLSDKTYPYDFRAMCNSQVAIAIQLERMDSERALLGNLTAKVQRTDPDLIVGHDVLGADLEVLAQRLLHHKIPAWSRLGRLRRLPPQGAAKNRMMFDKSFMCGRLVCDIVITAKELVRARSYDLETLCQTVLKLPEASHSTTFETVRLSYESSSKLLTFIKDTLEDALLTLRIMCVLNAMPLAVQITNVAGNVLSRTLMGGRSERNEFLLLHAFTERNFIPPEKQYKKKVVQPDEKDSKKGKGRKKPAYTGGLVLEPKKGFYDQLVLLMDFNSLYPSIIQEYNICFTTVSPLSSAADEYIPDVPAADTTPGILPVEIQKLVESRRQVKRLMKDEMLSETQKLQYDVRQMALKLTANSMYGCLGFSNSRFYAKPLASLITAKGREILTNTKELVENLSYDVIYGDTDSLMINTNCVDFEQVFKIGSQIKAAVNKMYRHVELDIDGVFKNMLLLKKKKYAALVLSQLPSGDMVTRLEQKGLDIVRRDWSRISAECGNFVLQQIMSDQPLDDRLAGIQAHLEKLRVDFEEGRVPRVFLNISKQLTKAVEQYSDVKSQPHVLVAQRLNAQGTMRLKAGDTVSYVICKDGTDAPATQRAYHLDEMKDNCNLQVDHHYYLAQQIHPVVSRLLEPIEEIDSAHVAEFLGLDPKLYNRQQKGSSREQAIEQGVPMWQSKQFSKCKMFSFQCMQCSTPICVDGPFAKQDSLCYPVLEKCANSQCSVAPVQYLASIQNALTVTIRSYVQEYYKGVLICEDPACPQSCQYVPQKFKRAYPVCMLCGKAVMYKEATDQDLYNQLIYFKHIFDLHAAPEYKSDRVSNEVDAAYDTLQNHVMTFLKHSLYSQVDLHGIFTFVDSSRSISEALKMGFSSETILQKLEENVTSDCGE